MSRRKRGKELSFTVDLGTARRLREAADQEDKDLDELIRDLVKAGLEKRRVEKQIANVLRVLTPREREVIVLVARGFTNKQIANQLVISPETVRSHIRNIQRKLDLNNKNELRVYLTRLGLILPE